MNLFKIKSFVEHRAKLRDYDFDVTKKFFEKYAARPLALICEGKLGRNGFDILIYSIGLSDDEIRYIKQILNYFVEGVRNEL